MEKFKQLLFSENGIKIVNMLFFLAFSGPQPCVSGCGIPGLDPFSGVLHQKSCESNLQDYLRLLYCFAVVMVVLNVVPVLLGL